MNGGHAVDRWRVLVIWTFDWIPNTKAGFAPAASGASSLRLLSCLLPKLSSIWLKSKMCGSSKKWQNANVHSLSKAYVDMDVSENSGFSPQIKTFKNRVFHYFHHPFWGTTIFGNTHMSPITTVPIPFQKSHFNGWDGRGSSLSSLGYWDYWVTSQGGSGSFGWQVAIAVVIILLKHPESQMDVSKNRGTPRWMVYNGKLYF